LNGRFWREADVRRTRHPQGQPRRRFGGLAFGIEGAVAMSRFRPRGAHRSP